MVTNMLSMWFNVEVLFFKKPVSKNQTGNQNYCININILSFKKKDITEKPSLQVTKLMGPTMWKSLFFWILTMTLGSFLMVMKNFFM